MAKKDNGSSAVRPPEGMARLGSVANAPWFNLKAGNVIEGYLENMYVRPDDRAKSGKSKFFQLTLTKDAEVRIGRGDAAEITTAKAGSVVNLNYGPKTKELESLVQDTLRGARFFIWAHVEGDKFSIGKGQTMWPIDLRSKCVKAPMKSEEPDFTDGVADEEEEADAPAAS